MKTTDQGVRAAAAYYMIEKAKEILNESTHDNLLMAKTQETQTKAQSAPPSDGQLHDGALKPEQEDAGSRAADCSVDSRALSIGEIKRLCDEAMDHDTSWGMFCKLVRHKLDNETGRMAERRLNSPNK